MLISLARVSLASGEPILWIRELFLRIKQTIWAKMNKPVFGYIYDSVIRRMAGLVNGMTRVS